MPPDPMRQRPVFAESLNQVLLAYLAGRSFIIVGIQRLQFFLDARRVPSLYPFYKTAEFRLRSSHLCLGGL